VVNAELWFSVFSAGT